MVHVMMRSTPAFWMVSLRTSARTAAMLPDMYLLIIVARTLSATRRSSSFWIAALPTHAVAVHTGPARRTASSVYMASPAATSPWAIAAPCRRASDAGLSLAGAGVDTASATIDRNQLTHKLA